jgi:Cu-processing system permease protein
MTNPDLRVVWTIAKKTLQELIRDRTISILFFGALVLVVLAAMLGSLSIDEQRRILIHLGFSSVHLTSLGIVLFQGAFILQREVDRQTCLMVLVRPLTRFQFLLGTFLGLAILLAVHIALQSSLLMLLLGGQVSFGRCLYLQAGIFIEMLVLLSFILFAAQWVRPILALFATLTLFLVGQWIEELKFLSEKSKAEDLKLISAFFDWSIPNLYRLNFRSESFLTSQTAWLIDPWSWLHFAIWILLFLSLAKWAFERRDLV